MSGQGGSNHGGLPEAPKAIDLHFEHYTGPHCLGIEETQPRLSWKFQGAPKGFLQKGYELEFYDNVPSESAKPIHQATVESGESVLVPWPLSEPLKSRQKLSVRVRAWGENGKDDALWSDFASVEGGLFERTEWHCQRIASAGEYPSDAAQPEELFRKEFNIDSSKQIAQARLYITAQGVYEAEINGQVVGDHFLAPGWTVYGKRLHYQTYDVRELLSRTSNANCIGIRLAEGWFCGRLGFNGGARNIFGSRPGLAAQIEVTYTDGSRGAVFTDFSWSFSQGPIRKTELYDGEKYDARLEIPGWSLPGFGAQWEKVQVLDPIPESTKLIAGPSHPVRRVATIRPIEKILTPSGKTILDLGQNMVGYVRIKHVKGSLGHKIVISHAEVLEKGELGRRPLRIADNIDEYTLKGDPAGESWEPRFTFHGFRYVQVDGWPEELDILESLEGVVCHTDMQRIGEFTCSEPLLNKLHENVAWSMRGNFLSVPTDCPQRDERLGWTGDLAVFAPTASLLYDCTGMLNSWLEDVAAEQEQTGGVPPFVVPNVLENHSVFPKTTPTAIWSDVAVLAPWALYQATGDKAILARQYPSMCDWMSAIPKGTERNTHLWDDSLLQLGDWLDPAAPPEKPWAGKTDEILVANAYLIHSLDLIAEVASILDKPADAAKFASEAAAAREEFAVEYVTSGGRLMSDSQTAYALAVHFNLFPSATQQSLGESRFAVTVRQNAFKIGTGFAGTPFICEALVRAGQAPVAFAMLLNKACPSWLYPVTMGATTIWERWDSMLPDGTVNPGEMTSFNHYALGAVARFMWERVAGLQCASPGWRKIRVAPLVGGDLRSANVKLETPYGTVQSAWRVEDSATEGKKTFTLSVTVPPNTTAEIVFPDGAEPGSLGTTVTTASGDWEASVPYIEKDGNWPVQAISRFP